ncbi:unnamed protein product [Leuciscus chuanchicus]
MVQCPRAGGEEKSGWNYVALISINETCRTAHRSEMLSLSIPYTGLRSAETAVSVAHCWLIRESGIEKLPGTQIWMFWEFFGCKIWYSPTSDQHTHSTDEEVREELSIRRPVSVAMETSVSVAASHLDEGLFVHLSDSNVLHVSSEVIKRKTDEVFSG